MGITALLFAPALALAHPIAPHLFCETYPDAPVCLAGMPACTYCHDGAPPTRNLFGKQIEALLLPGAARPLPDPDFSTALPTALHGVEAMDADMDGYKNLDEIIAGTFPADPTSLPDKSTCPALARNPDWDLCNYDPSYAFRKMRLDFCGSSPTYDELVAFKKMGAADQRTALDNGLSSCLRTPF